MGFRRPALTTVLLVAGALTLAPSASADHDHDDCDQLTDASFKGRYAASFQGQALAPVDGQLVFVPAAAEGFLIADGKGRITSATRAVSAGGMITLDQMFTCTYKVGSEGTGTATCTVTDTGDVEHYSFVLEGQGAAIRFLRTDPGFVVLGSARR